MMEILLALITPVILGAGVYYCGTAVIIFNDSIPKIDFHVLNTAPPQIVFGQIAFVVIRILIVAVMIGLLTITLFGISVIISEPTWIGRLIVESILLIIWLLFFWFVKLLRYLLNKGKNTFAYLVAIVPTILIWGFLFVATSVLAGF